MERKEFLTLLGVGAGSIVMASCLGACGKSDSATPSNPTTPGTKTVKTTINDVVNNQEIIAKGWTIKDGVIIALSAGSYIAVSSACTHAALPMTYDEGNVRFACSGSANAGHGSVFNVNGVATGGPALTLGTGNLKKYSTEIKDGNLVVYTA